MTNETFKKEHIHDICGKLNLYGTTGEYFKSMCQSIGQGYKDLYDDIYDDIKNKEYQEEVAKNKEFFGVGKDVIVDIFKQGYNAASIQEFSNYYSNDINKNDSHNIETKIENFFKSGTAEFESCQRVFGENYNGIQLKEKLGLTDTEYNRILGQGEYSDFDMFDYSGESNFLNDFDVDLSIIQKCYESNILDENGKQLFADFQIFDENGNKLQFKYFNSKTLNEINKLYIKYKESLDLGFFNSFNSESKKEYLQKIAELKDIKDKHFGKKKGDNLTKIAHRATGINKIKNEYREYGSVLKPAKVVSKAKNVGIAGVKLAFKGYKELSLLRTKREFRSALKDLKYLKSVGADKESIDITKELVALTKKELDEKLRLLKIKEKNLNKILHPYRSLSAFALDKISNLKLVRNNPISKLRKGVSDRISNLTTKFIFQPIGFVFKKPTDVIISILKFVAPIGAILGVMIVLFFIVGIMGSSVTAVTQTVLTMPLASQDDFDSYQRLYDSLDTKFTKTLENRFNGYAMKTNQKGEKIYYGVNGLNNEDVMKNNDYKNGIHYAYVTDEEHKGRTSNIEDLIAIMVVMMGQEQSSKKEIALGTLEWLYNISHFYEFRDSPLYACDSGCHQFGYKCTDLYHYYLDSDMRCDPFHALKMSGGDYEIHTPTNHCKVCEQQFTGSKDNPSCHIYNMENATEEDFYGCVFHKKCFHGDDGNMGRERTGCDNYTPHYECSHECNEENCTHDCSGNPIGCGGYWECRGHEHYSCDGHNYKCCMGHTDIRCVIEIKFFNWIKGYINRYDFGENDKFYQKLKNDPRNIYASDFDYYKSTE